MDYRPVGIFDSGMGGLTAVRVLRELLPGEDIAYLGDTARVPYGGRSVAELIEIARSDARFLRARAIKAMLVACGTVSSNCLDEVEKTAGVPVIGVVKPAAAEAAASTKNGRVGVLSTVATTRSGAFVRELKAIDPAIEPVASGSPLLVPLVEAGRSDPADPEVASAVEECLRDVRAAGVDTLILGCTHFPLLSEAIAAYMGEGVTLIDSGAAGARALAALLEKNSLRSPGAASAAPPATPAATPWSSPAWRSSFSGATCRTPCSRPRCCEKKPLYRGFFRIARRFNLTSRRLVVIY